MKSALFARKLTRCICGDHGFVRMDCHERTSQSISEGTITSEFEG